MGLENKDFRLENYAHTPTHPSKTKKIENKKPWLPSQSLYDNTAGIEHTKLIDIHFNKDLHTDESSEVYILQKPTPILSDP